MYKYLYISNNCCTFVPEKETNNNLNPKTRKGDNKMTNNSATFFESYLEDFNKGMGTDVLTYDFSTLFGSDQRDCRVWMTYNKKNIPGHIVNAISDQCKAMNLNWKITEGLGFVFIRIQ